MIKRDGACSQQTVYGTPPKCYLQKWVTHSGKQEGWYTKTEGKLLMVIARKNETAMILNLIKSIDDQAFISVGNVMGVYGKGFDLIKK